MCMQNSQSCSQTMECPSLSQYCRWSKKCHRLYEECFCNNCTLPNTVGSLYGSFIPQFTIIGETHITVEPEDSHQSILVQVDGINVEENDILAIQEELSPSVLKCEPNDNSPVISFEHHGWLLTGSVMPSLSNTQTITKKRCHIQAVYTQPVILPINPCMNYAPCRMVTPHHQFVHLLDYQTLLENVCLQQTR